MKSITTTPQLSMAHELAETHGDERVSARASFGVWVLLSLSGWLVILAPIFLI